MKAKKVIKLTAPADVQEFVQAASNCNFDIDVKFNHIIVDAKSFLAVLNLICHPVTVFCQEDNREFEELLDKYAVA